MVPSSDVVLVVDGAVENSLKLSFADLAQFPRQSLRATDELGKESLFEGVPVAEILKAAGVKFGKELRGKKLADYVLAETADGYRVVFALPEFDPSFKDTLVLLADSRDGNPLGDSDGQLRLIIPHEKRYARWVRQLVALHVKHS
jgi:DMSO/TMAO reductase YedYZ molybdopterin-dependent catalytic subunit